MSQSNSVAIVTGASRGLGRVIASVLAKRDYWLVINGRDPDALGSAAHELSADGAVVVPIAGDIVEPTVRAKLVDSARALGGLNVVVNNASELGPIGPLHTFDIQWLARLFPVNVGAPLALI